ncbi:DUF481 domain-containing protein [Winogradskyella aurantiaca]|uniref:DUF481 domain-containing protein n=1 Tax=Winogradskyella aurantiaca TaxID=2219558 RepID=UPI000E1DB7A4|nr:DUF481 domain-containing protein [Winogradskyella aurantiaca]
MKALCYILLCFPFLASAQLNESDSLKTKASLSLTGLWQGGNVQTLIFRARADFSTELWGKTVFKTQNSYIYQEFGKEKADEDILSLNFLYFNPKRKIYPLALGFVSSNFRRQIDVRYIVGGGASFEVYKKKQNFLKFSLTSEFEFTNYKSAEFNYEQYNGDRTIDTWRATIWINGKYYFFKKAMILAHEMYFQPSVLDRNNFRWSADLSLNFPIWKYLSFKINYLHTSERIVIAGQKQDDQFLTLGFTLTSFPDKNK